MQDVLTDNHIHKSCRLHHDDNAWLDSSMYMYYCILAGPVLVIITVQSMTDP